MDSINILIANRLDEVFQRQIAGVDRQVKVQDARELVSAELGRASGTDISATEREKLDSLLREAEVIVMWRPPLDLLSRSPRLKWVQLTSAGIDRALAGSGLLESDVIIANASGIHAIPIGEYVLGTMLMFAKRAPLSFVNKQRKRWEQFIPSELRDKTLGVVGLGSIGQEVARLARAFGMRVVATKRSVMRQEVLVMGVDKVYPPRDLLDMLSESDFVVLSVPFTKETATMIGEPELRAMKPTSYLINISRGGVIHEGMLIRALKEGWIAGAGLDVFATEPLPLENELWDIPNVIITPHIAGGSEMYNSRLTELFCDNLRRYLTGQTLLNVVDKSKGY